MTTRSALVAAAVLLAVAAGVAAYGPQGASVATAPAPTGAAVFRLKGCATCHDSPVGAGTFPVGPDLSRLPAVGSRVAGLDLDAYVRQSVLAPQAFVVPGFELEGGASPMPALQVSDAELDALVALLLGHP